MKKFENINDILKKIRNNIIPSKKPPASVDPKKMAKVAEDVAVAKEIIKPITSEDEKGNKDK